MNEIAAAPPEFKAFAYAVIALLVKEGVTLIRDLVRRAKRAESDAERELLMRVVSSVDELAHSMSDLTKHFEVSIDGIERSQRETSQSLALLTEISREVRIRLEMLEGAARPRKAATR